MQTNLPDKFLLSEEGRITDEILRSCVHCGFCNATCPTYLLTGHELDGPRGRIYLIKNMLEENGSSTLTLKHLDRCLTCQSCESTCPSSVNYHQLLDIGRKQAVSRSSRSILDNLRRKFLARFISSPMLMKLAVRSGNFVRPLLSRSYRRMLPEASSFRSMPKVNNYSRSVVLLEGCAQKALRPSTNNAIQQIFHRLSVNVMTLKKEGCCGALAHHLDFQQDARQQARRNIDQMLQALDDGAEYIISAASGCGTFLKEYERLFAEDITYQARAKRVCEKIKDISEAFSTEEISRLKGLLDPEKKLAFHCPCTLMHGQKLGGRVEHILEQLGYQLSATKESHICCGSAGTYSITQKEMSRQLQERKVRNLSEAEPDAIATANIGCQLHLGQASELEVKHWVEYIAESLSDGTN